jgi:hypothetical protein
LTSLPSDWTMHYRDQRSLLSLLTLLYCPAFAIIKELYLMGRQQLLTSSSLQL